MNRKLTEQELLERLEALPRELSPAKDAWPAIAQKIGAQSATNRQYSSNRWWFRAAAACVAAAFVAGILMGRQWDTASRLPQPESRLASQAYAPLAEALAGVLAASELEYQAAFREFVSVGESREYLPPQTVEKLDAGWADLREAEAAMIEALRQNPGNAFLSSKMLELRSRQIDFLKQIAALDQNNRRTTI